MRKMVCWCGAVMTLVSCVFAQEAQGPNWAPHLVSSEEAAEGFHPLFNGVDLEGWWVRGSNKNAFAARDGLLVVTGEPEGDWIFTDSEYENFVLRYEYRLPPKGGNSGVGIRAAKEGNPAFTGMEIQVITPGWENDWQRAGALYATVPPAVQADKPAGEWNEVEVLCDGPRIRTLMNGQQLYDIQTTDFTPEAVAGKDWQKPLTDRAKAGYVAIQSHGDYVEFRRIRIKPLPGGEGWRFLFNGKDLTGWQIDGDPIWHVLDGGVLRVDGRSGWDRGRNALRTVEEFADFELRLSIRAHERANSGVFFRCSGDDPWPRTYEAQVDNHNPEQFTGAIWDQVPASELRAMDRCWFQMHITARGPHIQVAVNGKTVVDYVSDRHEKFPKGWICLQGHDPRSVVDFRDIEIKAPGEQAGRE